MTAPRIVAAVAAGAVDRCVEVLRQPRAVVLLPTETVYGLVCRAADPAAVRRIYELKHRAETKPLALFTADWRRLAGVRLDGLPARLAERYCPGPITIVAPGTAGGTVGFRIPDHPFVLALLRAIGEPLASTSANRSGRPNVLSAAAALAELDGAPELTVDGGAIAPGVLASTVVDATGETPRILRQGILQIDPEI